MSTFPALRKRISSMFTGPIANQNARGGSPASGYLAIPFPDLTPAADYHEGDLFTPGTGNWVFESPFEDPIVTVWGNGYIHGSPGGAFNPLSQEPQYIATPRVFKDGMGGQFAGQMILQPLIEQGGA
jgi:hypothetical protein